MGLVKDYSHDPAKRALQEESAAHVEVQRLIEQRLTENKDTDICSPDFLCWIHPFLDGNGRVTRLFTHAYFVKARIDGQGMWTVSRRLARNRNDYLTALASADQHRQGDLDGRGNLSNEGLTVFCTFFLHMALDQIKFMTNLLDLDGLQKRIIGYVDRQASFGELLQPEAGYLLDKKLLCADTEKGAVRLSFPARVVGYYFPRLYPEGVEMGEE